MKNYICTVLSVLHQHPGTSHRYFEFYTSVVQVKVKEQILNTNVSHKTDLLHSGKSENEHVLALAMPVNILFESISITRKSRAEGNLRGCWISGINVYLRLKISSEIVSRIVLSGKTQFFTNLQQKETNFPGRTENSPFLCCSVDRKVTFSFCPSGSFSYSLQFINAYVNVKTFFFLFPSQNVISLNLVAVLVRILRVRRYMYLRTVEVEGLPHVLHMAFLFISARTQTVLVVCVSDFVCLSLLSSSLLSF